jgi:hypothetical protein
MIRARVVTCSDAARVASATIGPGRPYIEVAVADTIEFIATAIMDRIEAGNRLILTTGGVAPSEKMGTSLKAEQLGARRSALGTRIDA